MQKYFDYFKSIGSELIKCEDTSSEIIYKCVSCGKPETYLGVLTYVRRKPEALCKECQRIEAANKRVSAGREKARKWVEQSGAELIEYVTGLSPVKIKCPGCKSVFTYSTYNNLHKRNKDCLCESCLESKRALQSIQENIEYFEKVFIPLLKERNLKVTRGYPVDKDTPFYGVCAECGIECLYPSITTFSFYVRKNPEWRPLCNICMKKQIGLTQVSKNAPSFLKKARQFFKENGSKLVNKPKSSKGKFAFVCSNCKQVATRDKLHWFKENLNNFVCPDCNRKEAGKKRRVKAYRGQTKKRKDLFEYYNTWVRMIRRRWGKVCVISGSKEKIVAHHIYGFTRHPELAENYFNGVCLTEDLHKEFHGRYGRQDFGYFDFQEFYKEKTRKDFYLYQDQHTIVDIVKPGVNVQKLKKEYFAKGINYIPLFEHDLFNKAEILESILKTKAGVIKIKVFARECSVVSLPYCETKSFLQQNHRQGSVKSGINYGLKHPVLGLVAVMTFGKPRFTQKYDFELYRFCSRKNILIPGAASKLFKHFTKNNSFRSIVSYCDVRFSSLFVEDTMYSKIGFKHLRTTQPNYVYLQGREVYSRIQFQKHKLDGKIEKYDASLSETENMLQNGFSICYDCGNHVFVFSSVEG